MRTILWAIEPAKFFLILSVGTLISLSSCNKASIVGLDIQPETDLINADFVDSLTILTQTIKEDTLRTDINAVYSGAGLIGKYMDPIFGEATSSLYTQLRLFSNAPTFGTNPVCDSVRLSLYYLDSYGKKVRRQQTINVYQLTADLDINASYFSNQTAAISGVDLANGYVFKPRPTDSLITKAGAKLAPQLRVPLLNSFGQDILNQQNTPKLSTTEEFIKYIKGLYITTEKTPGLLPQEGNILQFNLNFSTLDIYYHYRPANATKDSSTQYNISLGSVARFTHFSHNYSAALPDLKKQIETVNPPAQNDVIYLQSMSGLKAKIKLPSVVSWGKKNFIAVNKAELIIKPISEITDTFALPPMLNLYRIRDDGKGIYPLPDAPDGTAEERGTYDKNTKTYHFTISRYIQALISERIPNNGLFLIVNNATGTPHRVVLGGGGNVNNPYQMKLNITYTKLN